MKKVFRYLEAILKFKRNFISKSYFSMQKVKHLNRIILKSKLHLDKILFGVTWFNQLGFLYTNIKDYTLCYSICLISLVHFLLNRPLFNFISLFQLFYASYALYFILIFHKAIFNFTSYCLTSCLVTNFISQFYYF